MAVLRRFSLVALLGIALVACGSKKPAAVPPPAPTLPAPTPTSTAAPTLSPEERAAVSAVKSYASKLGPIVSLGALKVDAGNGTALVEVAFANNVRQIFVATLESGAWTVLTASEPAG